MALLPAVVFRIHAVQLEKRSVHFAIEVGEEVAVHDEVVVAGLVERSNSELVAGSCHNVRYYSLKPLVPRSQVPLTLLFCSDGQIGQLLHGTLRMPELLIDMLAEGIECVNNQVCEGFDPAT
jgi:hypothetical protein